jgi:hypothetical protein
MASRQTLLTLRTAVRYSLDELVPSRWSNAMLLVYLNQAIKRVWTDTRRLREEYFMKSITSLDGSLTILGETYLSSTMAVTASGTSLTLPPDFSELYLLEVITSGYETVRFNLQEITSPAFRAAREVTTASDPTRFYGAIINERTLTYAPLSSRALDTRLTYIFRIADLAADGDTLQMPEPLDLAVVWYAVASALAQDQAPEATGYEQRASALVSSVTAADKRQNQDPVLVTSTWDTGEEA